MAKLNPIGFSKRTFAATGKIHVDKQILNAIESRGYLRKEIARVFQQANRRIQNVENSGIISPAVVALNKGDIKGFTKFSMKHDWNDLKIEYAKEQQAGKCTDNRHCKAPQQEIFEQFALVLMLSGAGDTKRS